MGKQIYQLLSDEQTRLIKASVELDFNIGCVDVQINGDTIIRICEDGDILYSRNGAFPMRCLGTLVTDPEQERFAVDVKDK